MKKIIILLALILSFGFILYPKDKDTILKEKAEFVLESYINYLGAMGDVNNYTYDEREQAFKGQFLGLFASTSDPSMCFNDLDPENKTSKTSTAKEYADHVIAWYGQNTGGLTSKFIGEYKFGKPSIENKLNYIPVYVTKEVRGNYMNRKFHNQKYDLEFRITYNESSSGIIKNVKIGAVLNKNNEPNEPKNEPEPIYSITDCNQISELFTTKLKANPKDLSLINKIVKLMADNGCTQEPLFLDAMQALYKLTPKNAIANIIGQLHMQNGDTDKALTWIEKSLVGAGEEEKAKAANTVLTLSKIAYKEGNNSKARSLAYKAADMGSPSVAANAYTFIGDLYMSTYKDCMQGSDIVQKRAVFLVAYDMYARGGDASKMASAKAQFPSKEDVYANRYSVGQSISVGCWINATTTIRTRD
jgi:hypothetical protein